eukprot:scaffold51189_cov21-Prasinocladus_malaysianus.AAC.1
MPYPYMNVGLLNVIQDFDLTHVQCGYPLKGHINIVQANMPLCYTRAGFNNNCRRVIGVTSQWTAGGMKHLMPSTTAILKEYISKCGNRPTVLGNGTPTLCLKIQNLHKR